MAAEGPSPRSRLWAAAMLLLGLPCHLVRADGECTRSVWDAAGPGVARRVWLGKAKLAGVLIRTSPENRKPAKERGERGSCDPASFFWPIESQLAQTPHLGTPEPVLHALEKT